MVPLHRFDYPVIAVMKMLRGWKFLCSFFKRNWEFEDYPVYSRPWVACAFPTPFPWQAFIIDWVGMHAGGNTGSQAKENLRAKFESFRRENELPRPGRAPKVPFDPSDGIFNYGRLPIEFFDNILRLPWASMSDESSLRDFDSEGTATKEYEERIRSYYGVDVSDIPGGKLVDIFKRIAAKRAEDSQIDQGGTK